MQSSLLLISAPVLGLACFVAAHLVLTRLITGRGQLPLLAASFLLGLGVVLGVGVGELLGSAPAGEALSLHLVNLGSYCGLGFGYFTFVNLNLASLRIRILKELLAAQGEALSISVVLSRYDTQAVLATRLKRMVSAGQLILEDGRYRSGPSSSFLVLAKIMNGFRRVIFGRNARPVGQFPS